MIKPSPSTSGIRANTSVQVGNFASDKCYMVRNSRSGSCFLKGWPQNDLEFWFCAGNNNERELKECLFKSGEPNWWKDFPDCLPLGSGQLCYDKRPAETVVK